MDYPGKVITKNQVTPTQTSATGVWTLDDAAAATRNNNWPVAGVPNPISKSLRFNTPDAAYLNRTPASASNRKTWTWSGWVKRSAIGSGVQQGLIGCSSGTTDSTFMNFQFTGDRLGLGLYTQYILLTTQLFRDVGAWYHIVVALDTTNATADNRCRMYINGVEVTVFTTRNNPTLNADYGINQATQHDIGRAEYTNSTCMGGYMTEINFIDGQALTPSSFGMTDPVTGVWEPLKYSGTYGTNGFYLNFKDATSTTTLGYDYSGNSNTWTTNNFSVTAGVGNDSLTDVPTPWIPYNTTGDVGGVVRGNYCTLNALRNGGFTLSNGNLDFGGTTSDRQVAGTIALPTSGKWYFEAVPTAIGANSYWGVGIMNTTVTVTSGGLATEGFEGYAATGNKFSGAGNVSYGSTFTTNDVIGVAVDMDNGAIYFAKNNTWQNSGVPTSGASKTGAAFTNLISSGYTWTPAIFSFNTGQSGVTNFGQRPFAYTPPSGFLSLCTTNLPASTILDGDQYFNTLLYTGNGSNSRTVTGVGFNPDFVWVKDRTSANSHFLVDIVRGSNACLASDQSAAEFNPTTAASNGGIGAVTTDGFTIVQGTVNANNVNTNTNAYVAWNWKANGAGSSNTAGTITSTVSANTTSGFSVVSWTGTGSTGTVGHGLGAAPSFIVAKRRNAVTNWQVYHRSLTANNQLCLNLTIASFSTTTWNSTEPTSSVFSIDNVELGANGATLIAYCFAAISGFSAFGSYTGNGSTDGPFVYLGFRPRFVMIKRTDSTANWEIWDTTRSVYNQTYNALYPNLSNAEDGGNPIDINSNGFKLRDTGGSTNATNTATYIYACFAENPFKNALAR